MAQGAELSGGAPGKVSRRLLPPAQPALARVAVRGDCPALRLRPGDGQRPGFGAVAPGPGRLWGGPAPGRPPGRGGGATGGRAGRLHPAHHLRRGVRGAGQAGRPELRLPLPAPASAHRPAILRVQAQCQHPALPSSDGVPGGQQPPGGRLPRS